MSLKKTDFYRLKGEILRMWPERRADQIHVVNTWIFRGRRYADIRRWFLKDDGKYHAGKGVRLTHADLRELRKGIVALRKVFDFDD